MLWLELGSWSGEILSRSPRKSYGRGSGGCQGVQEEVLEYFWHLSPLLSEIDDGQVEVCEGPQLSLLGYI